MGKIIAVASGKGGTGKTTFTANVALSLAHMGQRVLCLDCDITLRNLDLPAGLGHAGCVQKGQVLPALHMPAGDHLDLAPEGIMQLQGLLADFIHGNTVLSGHTISSGWKTSSNFSGVRKPSFTQASFREMFSLWASLAVLAALS